MSYSGPGLTKTNDSDISSYKRLEAKILAEERGRDPNFSTCPNCVARLTKHFHHSSNSTAHHETLKHHDVNGDGDILSSRMINGDGNSDAEDNNDNETDYFGDFANTDEASTTSSTRGSLDNTNTGFEVVPTHSKTASASHHKNKRWPHLSGAPERVHRYSHGECEEKQRFHGAFR